jgi:hypothetical protein
MLYGILSSLVCSHAIRRDTATEKVQMLYDWSKREGNMWVKNTAYWCMLLCKFIPSFRASLEVIFIDLVWFAQASKLSLGSSGAVSGDLLRRTSPGSNWPRRAWGLPALNGMPLSHLVGVPVLLTKLAVQKESYTRR